MRFQTIVASSLLLAILSFTASAATRTGLISLAAKNDCDRCVESSMIKIEPACANLPYIGQIEEFDDSKLSPQHRKCFCAIPPNSDWYQNCYLSEKCDAAQMDLIEWKVTVLRTETVCPTPGSTSAGATAAATNGASGRGVDVMAATSIAAVVAVFGTML
ncbi:hypothetical protein BGZ97_004319 [Linnemannia gamsii]|uniref:Uncharacterized protein n=1 Tax=Linnemannia gamsii TaxID=64522 RepID=A0A9P6QTW4_9FUNG|nr:hypothetical protein BGZ97_004319 [Linnemannia gamsii]